LNVFCVVQIVCLSFGLGSVTFGLGSVTMPDPQRPLRRDGSIRLFSDLLTVFNSPGFL